ncbi:NAD-dependent epimerase/dehydratase family protein [Phreatobacter stygius]|uniref:NAD-dependent epimerase/dehydratase family protein n=1 Tax=Phreatobacter stygius TaxID=1940610 RepID=A0A4D7BFM3_9HYPH|nr:NAD-dependent epimerase/dehydratase family protein [Phreatobacter stygius]QCI67996.1 NAD-dependent epimerase/dehydratase family protein [Phreatobacter stygius]
MTIFVTGATGYIGGSIAARLIAEGSEVRGLVRSADKAGLLAAAGVTPVLGDLDDAALLTREARAASGVVNAASSDHRAALEALIEGLAGSGKPLLHTSGSSVVADNARGDFASDMILDDDTPFTPEPGKAARAAIDRLVRAAADRGVRSAVLCNTMIYGVGQGLHRDSVQVPRLIAQARRSGIVRHVGQGANIWSNVHIDDLVDLYLAALAQAPAGSFYFVENGEASFRHIAEAISRRLGLGPPQAWSVEDAAGEWGYLQAVYTFGSNSRVRGVRARGELGWRPRHGSLTEWIEREA